MELSNINQQDLFNPDDPAKDPIFSDLKPEIVQEFFWWHRQNPHVYELFKRFATEAVHSGRKRFSAYYIMERIRWYMNVETKGDVFKLNNNHRPCYARLLILEDPRFSNFFETRHTPGSVSEAA
jgi:hypothetical protein